MSPLNPALHGLRPSATLVINELSAELARQGRRIYKLGFGQSPFPVPEPVVEELRRQAHRKEYMPVRGLPELRAAVARFHNRADSLEARPEDVLIGPGSKELMFLLQLAHGGDLLLPAPSWVSYAPQAQLLGRRVHWIPTTRESGWRLEPDALEQACKEAAGPSILVLNYPNNPTGLSYTSRRRTCIHRALASGGHRHHQRPQQVVRRRRLAPRHHDLPPRLVRAPRRRRFVRLRDLHHRLGPRASRRRRGLRRRPGHRRLPRPRP
jgi:histidinol-phosphate/aromatic aminotransferase/cobyric acid decarboxylase-like protein